MGILTCTVAAAGQAQDISAWPTYLHDSSRTGFTTAELTTPLVPAWTYQSLHPPSPAWPPPAQQDFWHNKHALQARVTYDRAMHLVSNGNRVFFVSSADDQLRCLDLETGVLKWRFIAEGPIRLAPTLHDDLLLFGSDDGSVYCVHAIGGRLVWRCRVSQSDRLIPGNGRIISSWPVRSGVLVDDRQAHFAAGLFPSQGTYQLVLDVASGKKLAQGKLAFSPQGYMTRQGENLMIATGRTPASVIEKLPATNKIAAVSLGDKPPDYPFALIGAGRLRFAGGDGRVAVLQAEDRRIVQTLEVRGKAYGLAVAGGALLVSTDQGAIHCFRPQAAGDVSGRPTVARDSQESSRQPDEYWPPHYNQRCCEAVDQIQAATGCDRGYCLIYGSVDGCLAYHLAQRTNPEDCYHSHGPGEGSRNAKQPHRSGRLWPSGRSWWIARRNAVCLGYLQFGGHRIGVARRRHFGAIRGRWPACCGQTGELPSLAGRASHAIGLRIGWTASRAGRSRMQANLGRNMYGPPLAGAGQWTHFFADPGNTACSGDSLARGPFLLQWFGEPGPRDMVDRHHRTVSPLCYEGRLFVPGNERVYAVDAYNGTPLWSRELPGFRRIAALRDAGNMAVAGNRLYVVAGRDCHVFDTSSGESVRVCQPPESGDSAPRDWGYVAVVDDRLFGSTTWPGASRTEHSRAAIGDAYYDARRIVTSTGVFCRACETGELSWVYRSSAGAILNPTICLGGGRIYFVESKNPETLARTTGRSTPTDLLGTGSQLVALDAFTGKEVWRRDTDFKGLEHSLYLCYADERLVAVGSRNARAPRAVPSRMSGTTCMPSPPPMERPFGDKVRTTGSEPAAATANRICIRRSSATRSMCKPLAYDLATGRRNESWRLSRGGHGCGALSACSTGLFFRAGNPCMFDLERQQKTRLTHATRPGCWINIIPANGLVLIPEASSGCTCKFSVQTSLALVPAALETMVREE